MPWSTRLDDVRPVRLRRAEAEQRVHDRRQLRLDHELPVLLGVAVRSGAVELVLLAERDDDLVDERVAEARDLDLVAAAVAAALVVVIVVARLLEASTETRLRSVEAHTPTTAFLSFAESTSSPSLVTFSSGTCSTIEWTP